MTDEALGCKIDYTLQKERMHKERSWQPHYLLNIISGCGPLLGV